MTRLGQSVASDLQMGKRISRAFIIFRQDTPGNHEGYPVAVYVGDNEACKADMQHRQSVNPDARYYVLDKPLNPHSERTIIDHG